MKIKWLLDVCLSPAQDLHLWEVLQGPRTERITAQNPFMFPRALSHHLMQKSPGLSSCCHCPLNPYFFLSSCSLRRLHTIHLMALPRSLSILFSPFFLSHSAAPRCQRSPPCQETADKLTVQGTAEGRALISASLPSSALPCYHDKTCIF